ncbi:MAG: short-chain dehydrogenase [Proteobacteria bacterium]|nr:short-chain dehydrogenase [Pseudomonadota bacterium]
MSSEIKVAITGANRGIGLALVKAYVQSEAQVFALCRTPSTELSQLAQNHNVVIEANVDVTSKDSLNHLVQKWSKERVSLNRLINNAGILHRDGLSHIDFNLMRRQFEVNTIGPLLVTNTLLSFLERQSKIAIVTSRMGSIGDNTSGGMYGYRASKAAVNQVGVSLAQDLKSREIAVFLLHPGFVRTEMTGGNGFIDATESATGLHERIESLTLAQTGSFWHANGEELPW